MIKTHPSDRAVLISEALQELRSKEYGPFGCLFFCADVVQRYTDIDYAKDYRDITDDKKLLQIYARFGRDITGFVTELLGVDPSPPLHAHVGDILAFRNPDGDVAAGVCIGARGAFVSPTGYKHPDITECLCSWRIK